VVTRIHAEAARALGLASVRERLSSLGAVPEPMAPDAFAAYVDTDIAKWQRLVQDRNIPME
jgi:tripartite-type tricarboxylate transporter receptor subunit TctC